MTTYQLTGYRRCDGRVGVRNKVLILPTCSCASTTAEQIARQVDGCVAVVNQNGCSQTNLDAQNTIDVLVGFAANPNVFATVLVGVGCEVCNVGKIEPLIRERTNKPLAVTVLQEDGGTVGVLAKGIEYARQFSEMASLEHRVPIDMSEIVLATECGGSDATSGLSANPVVGYVSDCVVKAGGTVILSETPELIGAEHILARRAATPDIGKQILRLVQDTEDYFKLLKTDLRESNPAPGNKKGGITTLEEKSLGCIYKGGTTPIQEVVSYGKPLTKKGLVIMDTPGNDTCSLTGMAAGGATVSVFTTGRGTPVGNPIMPVIKVTGNKLTYKAMACNIDLCTSVTIDDHVPVSEVGEELLSIIADTINGKRTKAEVFNMNDIAIARYCNFT